MKASIQNVQNGAAPEDSSACTEPKMPPRSGAESSAIMGGWVLDPSLLAIFEERARKLAIPLEQHAAPVASRRVLVFRLGEERFAIDSQFIVEVHTAAPITPIPGTAAWWRGLVNLRGRLYAALELRRWLTHKGLHTVTDTTADQGELVLVRAAHQTLAFVIDEVQAVRQLTAGDVRPAVVSEQESEQPLVLGMTDDLIVLLDVEAIANEVKRQTQISHLAT